MMYFHAILLPNVHKTWSNLKLGMDYLALVNFDQFEGQTTLQRLEEHNMYVRG